MKPLQLVWFCVILLPGAIRNSYGSVTESDLFPHDEPEDTLFRTGDDTTQRYDFKVPFSFFNQTYESVFVSDNGQVSFGQGITTFTPSCTPSTTPMIMAFWGDINWVEGNNSKILYRETTNRTMLQKAQRDVVKAFPLRIKLSWMFVTTWKNVPFYGSSSENCRGFPPKRNTFQLVLTSDGTYSFALMYYSALEWTTGRASSGSCDGLGGIGAKAGFDYGDQLTWHTIEGSCTDSVVSIAQSSNFDEPGKWAFRIDSSLETLHCTEFQSSKRLRLTPSIVPFMGVVPLEVEGPCIVQGSYKCVFHDVDQYYGLLEHEMDGMPTADFKKIVCPMPVLSRSGRVRVDLEYRQVHEYMGGQVSEPLVYSGYLYVVNNGGNAFRLRFNRTKDDEVIMSAEWDPEYFQREIQLDVFHNNSQRRRKRSLPENTLDMVLESFDGRDWIEHGVLQSGVENTGRFNGVVQHHSNQLLQNILSKKDLFTIHLRRTAEDWGVNWSKLTANIVEALDSVYEAYKAIPGPLWLAGCAAWTHLEGPIPTDTLACPPTVALAVQDPNFEADGAGRMMRFFHPGGVYSVRQKVPSPSKAGSQCVYGEDGGLMVGPMGGGTLDRFSPNYDVALHLLHDVLPYLACCRMSGYLNRENCANEYYRHRPSDDGANYPVRRVTRAVGDPHITTFDGYAYTFNGVGEFWMVKAGGFLMQARMEQYVGSDGVPMNASVFTTAVMEETTGNSSGKVQVCYSNGELEVLLDGENIDGAYPGIAFKFKSMFVSVHSSCKVGVASSSGFSFDFEAIPGSSEVLLNIIGTANSGHAAAGLMGNNDGEISNDLQLPDGEVLDINSSSPEQIHYKFGLNWIVRRNESLFTYAAHRSYEHYVQLDFKPNFLDPGQLESMGEHVRDQCGGQLECVYDLITTGSALVASATKNITQVFVHQVEVVSTPVRMCEPMYLSNGYTRITSLLPGGQLESHCDQGFVNKGAEKCTCVEHQEQVNWECGGGFMTGICEKLPNLECETPVVPKFGEIVGTSYSLGSKIELRCMDGRGVFWGNCPFSELCLGQGDNCGATYECVEEEERNGRSKAVWKGIAQDIGKVRCLTRFGGEIAKFVRKQLTIVILASGGKLHHNSTKSSNLIGC